jgi:hypothetical protein
LPLSSRDFPDESQTGINVKVEGVVRCVNRWETKSLTRHPTRNDSQS